MSNNWTGSSAAWRRVRLAVLERDAWQCQLNGPVCQQHGKTIPRDLPRDDPRAAQVHHTRDRSVVGDDPAYLLSAHRGCNLKAGDPRKIDPRPAAHTAW